MLKQTIYALMSLLCISCAQTPVSTMNPVKQPTTSSSPSRVEVLTYPSDMGEAGIAVYLPAGYDDNEESYPTLYLLHGSGDNETGWVEKGRAQVILDSMIINGYCRPMVVVMPNGYLEVMDNHREPRNWMDAVYEPNFPNIIRWAEQRYRLVCDKEHRAIAGLSMGGFHAMHVSASMPQTFDFIGIFSGLVVSHSSAIDFSNRTTDPECLNECPTPFYRNTLRDLDAQMNPAPHLYWIAIGSDDFLYQDMVNYRAYLDKKGYDYQYHESAGGHTWENWMDYLRAFLPRLF